MGTRRVLLKLSGEALAAEKKTGFDHDAVMNVAHQVRRAMDCGAQIAIVIGGGNFWRGRQGTEIDRVSADQIGMLATAMNCIYVSSAFRTAGIRTAIYSAFPIEGVTSLFNRDMALADMEAGKVVFFSCGTGHPYFSTDTGVVLRALQMGAEEILMAKSIDGVYDSDPAKNPDAVKYDSISIGEVLEKRLGVIDLAASALVAENKIPLAIFGLEGTDAIYKAICGEITGTRITV